MKLSAIVLGLLSYSANAVAIDNQPVYRIATPAVSMEKLTQLELGSDFIEWTKTHSKEYASEEVMLLRFAVWKDNHEFVQAHNKLAARGKRTFTVAINHLADMSNDEYRLTLLGKRQSSSSAKAMESFRPSVRAAPDAYDWRTEGGVVNSVKNQAQCGSCWAFSAVAAMEGAFNRKANGSVPLQCKGTTCGDDNVPCCSFSEQELVDCVNKGKDNCNTGGEMHDGIVEIVKDQGGMINTEKQYPYSSGGGTSKGVCHADNSASVPTGITGYANVTSGDEAALKQASYEKTIISIGIDASQQSFQFYSSGVYDEPKCHNKVAQLDHGVAIVGYGVGTAPAPGPSPGPAPGPSDCVNNNDKKSCSAESGCHWCPLGGGDFFCFSFPCVSEQATLAPQVDYWWVRNSWGESWGMDGYIQMSRNKDNQCGVASDAIYALIN